MHSVRAWRATNAIAAATAVATANAIATRGENVAANPVAAAVAQVAATVSWSRWPRAVSVSRTSSSSRAVMGFMDGYPAFLSSD
jgi:hypothetical protein